MQLILASTSPRRRELLALLGLPFDVCAPGFEEQPQAGLTPLQHVTLFAREKARSVSRDRPSDLVLGSDTVIEFDGAMLGKPADPADARSMLTRLSGRCHQVHTAVAICRGSSCHEALRVVTASVHMKAYDRAEVDRYLTTGESMGKAGAYSIQGAGGELIARIDGDYLGVVGLPLRAVAAMLTEAGLAVPVDVERLYREKPYPNWAQFTSN